MHIGIKIRLLKKPETQQKPCISMPENLIINMVFREICGILTPHNVKQTLNPSKNNKIPASLVVYTYIVPSPGVIRINTYDFS